MILESVLLKMLLYFGVGILLSGVVTLNMRMVSERNALFSAISSFVSTLLGLIVVAGIISEIHTHGIPGALAYASGIAFGSFFVVKYKK